MTYAEFRSVTTDQFESYLSSIHEPLNQGRFTLGRGFLTYPNIVLYSQADEFYIAEFVGCQPAFGGLVAKDLRRSTTRDYFTHYNSPDDVPTFLFDAEETGVSTVILTNTEDISVVRSRYRIDPTTRVYTKIVNQASKFANVQCGPNLTTAYINNCYFINQLGSSVRMRHVQHAVVVSKNLTADKYRSLTKARLEKHSLANAKGANDLLLVGFCVSGSVLAEQRAAFLNLITMRSVSETTVGFFLASNAELLTQAFSIRGFLHEKKLEWKEGNPDPTETSIKPDFLLERPDGIYDILDLKMPKWDLKRLTKGGHKRRRFVDYVAEGIAQLVNYADYFTYPANRSYAYEHFGIRVDSPTLYLIVGNYENLPKSERIEALRAQRENVVILDYDTVNALASIRPLTTI